MISTMPRPRPPHLHRETTRHGRTVWYVRVGQGPRRRIKAEFGTPEFETEYQAALTGAPRATKGEPGSGSLSWLVERYRETAVWNGLSEATRRQRENIFKRIVETAGNQIAAKITQATVIAGRDRRAATPHQARHFLDTLRGLFRWATKAKMIKADPTAGVENPETNKGHGFRPWTEEDVTSYETRWPIGTRQRVWVDILLYTGLRRGDAVRLGRQHVRDGVATIRTEKTDTTVTLPILPVLAQTIAAGPCGELTFICGERGQPLTKESFGNEFRVACNKACVPGSAHGVRKIAATRAAENGATVAQLEAIFGWSGGGMASLYTRSADRKRLAIEAVHKLENRKATSIPAPQQKVREPAGKTK